MRRINFFAKPKIQIKYVVVTILLVLLTGVAAIWVMQNRMITSYFAENLSDGEIFAMVKEVRTGVFYVLALVFVMALLQSVIFFHRLIGPIVALERVVDLMLQGKFGGSIKLRKHDEMKDLAEKLEDLGNKIREVSQEDKRKIYSVIQKLEKHSKSLGGDWDEIKRTLEETGRFFEAQ